MNKEVPKAGKTFAVAVFLPSLLPFLWISFPYVRMVEELLFVNYGIVLRKYLYAWVGRLGMGFPNLPTYISTAIPNTVFYYIGELLGFDISVIQALFLSLVIFATLLSIHTLIFYLTKNKVASLLVSLFYLFNFYSANVFFYSAKMYQLILMPLLVIRISASLLYLPISPKITLAKISGICLFLVRVFSGRYREQRAFVSRLRKLTDSQVLSLNPTSLFSFTPVVSVMVRWFGLISKVYHKRKRY